MSNSQIKKAKALSFNNALDKKNAIALDKKVNPDKYYRKPKRKTKQEIQALALISAAQVMFNN